MFVFLQKFSSFFATTPEKEEKKRLKQEAKLQKKLEKQQQKDEKKALKHQQRGKFLRVC
jgi:uncharacterized protein YdaU (DUF1376 family)